MITRRNLLRSGAAIRRPSWGSVHNAVSTSHSFLDISPTVFAIDHADVTVVIGSMSRIVP